MIEDAHSNKGGDPDYEGAVPVEQEEPRPLMRELPPAKDYPVEVFGPVMQAAIAGIYDCTQAPLAICAQSVLAVAAVAAQPHFDVETLNGSSAPISLLMVSVAESGDRKSSADRYATEALTDRESELAAAYSVDRGKFDIQMDAWKHARDAIQKNKKNTRERMVDELRNLGPQPEPPLEPILTAPEPTYEGLVKLLAQGQPSMGLFSAEGGQFIAGHAMNKDNRIKTAAGLSEMWDGAQIKRVRVGDGVTILRGRRVSMHLMVQPGVATTMLGDTELADQGLLSRVLVAAPETLAGTRAFREPSDASKFAIRTFRKRVLDLLRLEMPLAEGTRNELKPPMLRLSKEAKSLLITFHDEIEGQIGRGGRLLSIKGFANKVPEHAARLAGVMAAIEGAAVSTGRIDADYMEKGIVLARHYMDEALRLFYVQRVSSEIVRAQAVLKWAQTQWEHGPLISLVDVYQRGPSSVRTPKAAEAAVKSLVECGWLVEAGPGLVIGKQRRQTWRISGYEGPAR